MRSILISSLILVIGVCLGEYLFQIKHNPDKLRDALIYDIGNVYMRGCIEAMNTLANKKGYYDECRKLSYETVKEHRELLLNKIWNK